jgi:hypothetical protein
MVVEIFIVCRFFPSYFHTLCLHSFTGIECYKKKRIPEFSGILHLLPEVISQTNILTII